MTSELVKELRELAARYQSPLRDKFMSAADRIEALERGCAELRDGFKASQDAVFALTRDLTVAESREARLREALEKIAREQSAKTATEAADRFQSIARAALKEATNG